MNDKMIHEQEAQKYFDFAVAYLNLPEGTKKKKKNHDKAVTIADLSRDWNLAAPKYNSKRITATPVSSVVFHILNKLQKNTTCD